MMNKPDFLSNEKRDLFTRFLSTKDYERAADLSGYSFSSVNNILNQRTRVNDENIKVVAALTKICRERIEQVEDYISKARDLKLLTV